jgi:hypothetical protein
MAGSLTDKLIFKRILWYGLVGVILLAATSMLQKVDPSSVHIYYYTAQIITLLLGMLHLALVYRLLLPPAYSGFWVGLLVCLLIVIAGVLGSAILYYYLKMNYAFLSFVLPFFVPYICRWTYRYFIAIPQASYKIWYYPMQAEMPDLDMIDLSQIEVVQFVFSKRPQDKGQTNFTSKAPLNMTLGQLFFIFINDYNEKNSQQTIGFLDDKNQPHGWLFYRKKKWFGRRHYFDPDNSFRDNRIQPNEFIYGQRVVEW